MADQGLAVVTGGAAGLGRVITTELAERGLRPVIADLDEATAAVLINHLESRGHSAVFLATDAADVASVEHLMETVAGLGTLRLLVNNAGGWLPGPQYPETTRWRRSIDLNLLMPMLAAQLAVPLMSATGGAIVNVSSSGGIGGQPYGSPEYGAAKAGLIRFTSCVADWADSYRVRVNCVVPHWIGLDRARQQYQAMSPSDRRTSGGLVDPALVASTVVDLALDQESNGRVVVIRPDRDPYDLDDSEHRLV